LKLELNSSKLNDVKKDPEVWISSLEVICQKLKNMNYIISEEDLFINIVNNLPRDYEAMTDQLEIELDNESNDIGITDVKARLQNKYNKLKNVFKKLKLIMVKNLMVKNLLFLQGSLNLKVDFYIGKIGP
jgi:gag-polypeptide of LTR copia-type